MLTHIITGLGIGLLGSFHCIGMCGPLAVSLPLNASGRFQKWLSIAAYNMGRATTYLLLGVVFGAIGRSFFLVGYQQALSVAAGVFILLVLFFSSSIRMKIGVIEKFQQWIKKRLTFLLSSTQKTGRSYFLIGLVNGLLPCGLVYLAIASAVATGSAWQGGILMLSFGLGTIPLLFVLMIAGNYFSVAFRYRIRKLVPLFAGLMACILILRGLNLGIPYISPALQSSQTQVAAGCHTDGVKIKTIKR